VQLREPGDSGEFSGEGDAPCIFEVFLGRLYNEAQDHPPGANGYLPNSFYTMDLILSFLFIFHYQV
jgi:hypothetical protein